MLPWIGHIASIHTRIDHARRIVVASWNVRLNGVDQRLFLALLSRRRPWMDGLMRGITLLAELPVIVAIALVLASGAMPGVAPAGLEALVVLVVSHALVQIIKRLATRPRPRLPVGVRSIAQAPDRFSFPSGHATAALAVALPLVAVSSPGLAALILCVAALVGVSRCYLGIHYPGDVVFGWGLAMLTWAVGNVTWFA